MKLKNKLSPRRVKYYLYEKKKLHDSTINKNNLFLMTQKRYSRINIKI